MAPVTRDVDYLTEFVREALGRQICQMYQEDGVLTVLTLSSCWEEAIAESIEHTDRGLAVALDPGSCRSCTGHWDKPWNST